LVPLVTIELHAMRSGTVMFISLAIAFDQLYLAVFPARLFHLLESSVRF
jgi:hypothetical protein